MEDKIIQIMSDALMGEDVTAESSTDNLTGWDSLGHLSILSALDDASGGKVSEINEFNDVTSVKEIVSLCEAHGLNFS